MNDYTLAGVLFLILLSVFYLESLKNRYVKTFFLIVPPLLLCYFLPSLLYAPFRLFDPTTSKIPSIGSQFCLPACLILFCLNLNLKEIYQLGPKLLLIFLIATTSVIIGGPVSYYFFTRVFPDYLPCTYDDLWRGLSTVAGSWIGGSVNQTAMKEVYQPSAQLFAAVLVVDVAVASLWMSFLLFLAGKCSQIDLLLKAKDTHYNKLLNDIKQQTKEHRISTTLDFFKILSVAFGGTALAHLVSRFCVQFFSKHSEILSQLHLETLTFEFFWLVLIATCIGILLSLTKAKKLDEVGSMTIANVLLYFLIATIGLKIDLTQIHLYWPLFILGLTWMLFHAVVIFSFGRFLRLPLFFIATSSMANIGGAASAPVVASAFNPNLAPIGVLLAILGYALGNYGAIISAWLMQLLVP